MARSFNGSTDKINPSGTGITDYPFTISSWFNTTNPTVGTNQVMFDFGVSASNNNNVGISVDNPTGKFSFFAEGNGAGYETIVIGSALSANTWYSGILVGASATSRTGYLNGSGTSVNSAANKTLITPFTNEYIGHFSGLAGAGSFMNGLLAEIAIWNVALAAAEIDSLAKAYSPLFIRPGNLVSYWPLIGRTSPEIDLISGNAGTLTGTTAAGHPRVIIPRRGKYVLTIQVQYLRPDADDADGSWTNELGNNTNLFASIDEASLNDADYIQSSLTPVNDVVRVRLSDPPSGVAEPVKISYRYQKEGSDTINLVVRLKESTTTKATWTHNNISTSLVTANQTLSGGEFASISDWSNLFLEFEADIP